MKILANFEKMRMWSFMLAVLGASFTSCSNILDEENVDCSVTMVVLTNLEIMNKHRVNKNKA